MIRRGTPGSCALALVATLAIAALAGCASDTAMPTASAGATRVTVASEHCGAGWSATTAGAEDFLLANTDIVTGEVFLVDARTDAVFAYVDDLAPGATATMRVTLAAGRYSFRCAMSDAGVARGAIVVLHGAAKAGPPPVRAVTDNDLVPVAKAYQRYVASELPGLQRSVDALRADLVDGNLAKARADWLPAHLAYERLGAAYGAFGDADTAINGVTAGLPDGVRDSHFTGFHRIEYGLWHGAPAGELAPYGRELAAAVRTLGASLADSAVGTLDIAIRTHEIAENALQFDLTGQTDYGSGTSLASVAAELDGTAELLTLMTPILSPRYPGLRETERALAEARADVAAERIGGTWTPLGSLARADRERIDADLGGLAALLAPIASIAEPRITS